MKIFLTVTNSVDPSEMPPYAAFHQGLHCLQNSCLGVRVNLFRRESVKYQPAVLGLPGLETVLGLAEETG